MTTWYQRDNEMKHQRVLFVCTHNGARSRIAEEFTRRFAADRIEAVSSSFESETIGPLPVSVMREVDIELPTAAPNSVFERFKVGEKFDYVIAICDPGSAEQVPIFLSGVDTLYAETADRFNWSVPNFRSISGSDEARREKARDIRDQIKSEVLQFLSEIGIDTDFG